jgi:hypothetical protein
MTKAHEVPQARWDLLHICDIVLKRLENEPPSPGRDAMLDEIFWLRVNVQDAVLWFVSPDMTDLLIHAWPSLPPTTLTPELLPDETGFVVFANKIRGTAADKAEPLLFDGYVWGPAVLDHPSGRRENVVSLAAIVHYQGQDDYWGPLGHTDWTIGKDCDDVTEINPTERTELREASMIEDRRMMATFWLLATQPNIAETTDAPIPRPWRRAQQREGRPVPRVRLIDVRRPKHSKTEPSAEHRDIEWTHRWIVSAHWRQQAYGPGRSLRRPRLIAPYMKGPDDKPLIVPESVKVWKR